MASARPMTRSSDDRMIAGVCGGIAEYFGWSAFRVRVVYVIGSLVSAAFPGLIVYLFLWFLLPESTYGDVE